MKRVLLALIGPLALIGLFVASTAQARAPYPNKPIRLVVPFAVGGGTDIISRLLGARMTQELG